MLVFTRNICILYIPFNEFVLQLTNTYHTPHCLIKIQDVLFGRGTPTNNHPGNLRLRLLVDIAIEEAATASKPGRKKEKRVLLQKRLYHKSKLNSHLDDF